MDDPLPLKQVEVLLDIHSKKLLAEIKQLREELSQLRDELSRENEVKQDPPVSQAVEEPKAQPVEGPKEFQPKAVEKPAAAEPVDRNGVAPEDVSIEKFFYVGGQ